MKRQDYVFGSTTTNVEEQSASALNNGWAELSILYSRVLNGVCAALSQSTNYVSQEVANAIEGMGAELDPANNSQLLTVLQSLAIKESDFQTPVTPTNKGATMKEIEDLVTTSFVFKGYVSTTAPAQNLVEGNLWINSATMPTNFPIAAAAVKQWNGSEWVAYGSDYAPGNFDCFRNLNDNEGYYWFGGEWQVISTDLSTDYFTLNQVSGRWEIKNSVNLPGTPTCDTPSASNTRAIVNVDFVNNNTISSRNFTNCLTEIPQDIKLELNNGTLTLKAGSKVYVPNGAGNFDELVIQNDLTTITSWGEQVQLGLFVKSDGSTMFIINMRERCSSGSTPPTATNTQMWYDTTNNLVKRYGSGSDTGDRYSLPIALVQKGDAVESSNISSIDQVFNGFGYIGSTVFALPGIKWLAPNGRNADGTLRNNAYTSTKVQTFTYQKANQPYVVICMGENSFYTSGQVVSSETEPSQQYTVWYKPSENILRIKAQGAYVLAQSVIPVGSFAMTTTGVSSIYTKTAFHAVDYNDLTDVSKNTIAIAAPAGIVAPFAGTTPPAGWLKCDGSAISRTTYAKLFAAIGGNYGTGDGSTTFNLPNLTGRVPFGMEGSYVGQSTNGVLPNITGSLYGAKGGSNPSGTGAIAVYGQNYEGTFGSGGGQYYNWDFNASRSNSMYGNGWYSGERVVPASVGMTYCIKY